MTYHDFETPLNHGGKAGGCVLIVFFSEHPTGLIASRWASPTCTPDETTAVPDKHHVLTRLNHAHTGLNHAQTRCNHVRPEETMPEAPDGRINRNLLS